MSDEPPADDIMEATYSALCKHGFADVTMQDIAAESTKSKAALHYHYDDKHSLLLAFLDDLHDTYTTRLDDADGDTPLAHLLALLDTALSPPEDGPNREFGTAVLELKAQGPYDDAFRDRLARFERALADRLETVLADGIDAGAFRSDLDVAATADFLVTAVNGAQARSVATKRPVDQTRETLERFIETSVLTDDAPNAPGEDDA